MQQTNEQLLVRPQSPVLRALRAAAPQTLPVLAGYFVLGMGYGITYIHADFHACQKNVTRMYE